MSILRGAAWLILSACVLGPAVTAARAANGDACAELATALEARVKARLSRYFKAAGLPYPLDRLTIIALKGEKQLEVWADTDGKHIRLRTYPILAASGVAGPKLREGDCQVPEGIYRIVGINPRSRYHISLALDYPNVFDLAQARRDRRTNLGNAICIHGKACSIGCIAIGDPAIEELFVLVYRAGLAHVRVLIAPNDLRRVEPMDAGQMRLPWVKELYALLKGELAAYI